MPETTGVPRFGQLMRKLRKSRRMTQLDLALEAEVDLSYISMLETGRKTNPSSVTVRKLAHALRLFGISLEIFKREAAMARGMLSKGEQADDFGLFLDIMLMFEVADEATKAQLRLGLKHLYEQMSSADTPGDVTQRRELQSMSGHVRSTKTG